VVLSTLTIFQIRIIHLAEILEKKLSEAMQYAARRHGVLIDALVNI
jgi:hypothetical protein